MRRLIASYFRIFERQLKVMQTVIEQGQDYLSKGAEPQAMEVVKLIAGQMQWTVDLDLRLGMIFYDKQDWEHAFHHLFRAYLTSGADPAVGVRLAAVAMKLRKKELAKTLLSAILNSELTDPKVREYAVQVARAITAAEAPAPAPPAKGQEGPEK